MDFVREAGCGASSPALRPPRHLVRSIADQAQYILALEKQLTQLKLRNPFYNLWYTIADMWQASRNIAGPAKRVAHPRSSARVPRWLKRAGDLLTWALAASVVLAVIAAGVSYITSLHPSAASPSSSTAPAQLRSAIVNTPSDIGVLY